MSSTVTDVQVRLAKNDDGKSRVLAYANIVINGDWRINNLKVVNGKSGYEFVAMPQRKGKDEEGKDKWFDEAHPISSAARKTVTDAVLAAYRAEKAKSGSEVLG